MKKPISGPAEDSIDDQTGMSGQLLATGGGNSSASGVTFQGLLSASFSIAAVLDRPVDSRLGLGATRVRSLRFETEAPVDDIDSCLRSVLKEMIEKRALQILSSAADSCDQTALTRLLKNRRSRSIGRRPRHCVSPQYILFDYAASRLYLDPAHAQGLIATFERGRGLGLLLAPALAFALQELWCRDSDRYAFWNTVLPLVADKSVDPIARSVAARSSSELPANDDDVNGLIEGVLAKLDAAAALDPIFGSLGIRLEAWSIS